MSAAIEFDNISKLYRLGLVSTGTLAHDLKRWWTVNVLRQEDPYLRIGETNDRSTKGESDYVWALKDIDFKVEQGDVVGIIGKNGAGKSTLLKILSKVTAPTTGTIKAKGRIGSLLEVGTGFHPEMTGRENIYLNGAILGMTKHEIAKKLDEIVDFSGCERYIDTPVKRYSSGMMVRLGFAVAAHLDPEILVVDEVLAVGDAEFQKKAIGKMQDVSKGEGRTVLFVSHNMSAVKRLCNTGVLLKNGFIDYLGTAESCINHYLQANINSNAVRIAERKDRGGNGAYRVINIRLRGLQEDYSIPDDIPITIELDLAVANEILSPRIGVSIYTMQEECVAWMDSASVADVPRKITKNFTLCITVTEQITLLSGDYFINVVCFDSDNQMADYVQHAIEFKVRENGFPETGVYPMGKGWILPRQKWVFA